ncbi:uncharacterized protein LOC143425566 [Xylocopa sonorina]|uniref:uncharacterized protein LOC143425566 n=1 Tax=Xylocopa sonorina TaxID=1818115 RepID=UPI00403ABD1F
MSSSGYRGRSFGPRGARTNGPANGFNGPRFPHPNFNPPRPPHRLSGHDKWIERPNFAPWQQNKNFHPHPQYRGNLQYRSNNRGRVVSGRGIIRFSGPGRPPALQYGIGFIRNPVHRTLSPEEQVEDRPALISQTPLLGSEEERQQKILETADKLKQKLSSITEEELTNFWEDDLSVLPNNNSEEENSPNKGIPELRHEPPELDLTFTDFRDIGRVDCNNSKFDNVDSKSNNDISISFEHKSTDDISISTNEDITIIDENKEEFVITLDSTYDKDDQDQSNILLEDDRCFEQAHRKLSNFECNIENLQLQDNVAEDFIHSDSNNVGRNASTSNFNKNIKNLLPIESTDNLITDKPSSVSNVETTSMLPLITNDQDRLQVDFLQNRNNVQLDIQDTNVDITRNANVDVEHSEHTEKRLPENNQIQDSLQTSIRQDETHKNVVHLSDSPQNKPSNFLPSNEETHASTICDSSSPSCTSNYNEAHKVNDDKKLNNSLVFQPRGFNIPTRFTQRAAGPRCRWTFQQNGKNLFFRGPQRLPFLSNRMPTPRHVLPFKTPDLVPVGFDPRAPPPFSHNVPVSSHDSQHNVTVPFSSNNLPPAFDPSEPPPNIRQKSGPEPSNVQEKSMPPLVNTPQSNLNVTIPLPAFDPRGPPPRILPKIPGAPSEKLPEFNPQQPPPKIHKREETLQPPPIFDPRLSSHERSSLITPLDTSRTSMMPLNLMETSPVADFSIAPVTPVFSQLPPINIPAHQPFISNMQMNFPSVLPQANSGQGMMTEFPLPPPSLTMTEVPPPPPKELSMEVSSNLNQNINMDDGLEDMQEAMEFAKQIMNMTEEIKTKDKSSVPSELAPLEIPVPTEATAHSSTIEKERVSTVKKERKKENRAKKNKQNVICGPELILEKQEEVVIIDEEKSIENRRKNTEEALLSSDQIRPKVVFNLNTKMKKIQKPEEWQKTPINEIRIIENRETFQSSTTQRFNKQRVHSRQHPIESRRSSMNQNKNQQKENEAKKNTAPSVLVSSTVIHEKLSSTCYHRKSYTKDSEKLHLYSSKVGLVNNLNTQKNQRSRKETRKEKLPVSESSWKNRVISRFLKMSKNDICNMVNNSSLRKFDIAMKHLVKERRSSLSLEMRNTEDEKMKEYDREEFMNQLNAMLDPSAVVGITDLPTEFIHHLSEVLQLDSMPCDVDAPEIQNPETDQVQIIEKEEISRVHASEYLNEENPKAESLPPYLEPKTVYEKHVEEQLLRNKEESVTHHTLGAELNLNILREDSQSSSHRSLSNKINPEMEGTHKKQQQPLFNEADLDDILSEVTGKTKNLSKLTTTMKPVERTVDTRMSPSLMQTETEEFGYNTFSRDSNKTAADLDDIFSAGIARVKLLGKTNVDHSGNLRIRKSSSEDRNTFRPEKYEKWHRKERDDPDMFRNLTKEEWEEKYGPMSVTTASTIVRKCVSNSNESLNKDNKGNRTQRHCSSDSPMRRLSVSPLSYEVSAYDFVRNEMEESRRTERSETSSDSSSSSSSDTDQETAVAPDVTKLLKVIKQKEKIAKKRSINETIRDEVAAEIEKKWKEKSKHKERRSCKREKRKRDKKERRRKEKRKKRKRDSYSESSRSVERTEGSRLLTEDEIKKEVIVKEEPVNLLEENVVSSINDTYVASTLVNKTVHSQIEYQCSQVEKEQRFLQLPVEKEAPAVACDTASSQTRSKPVIVSVVVQPKTKAQLKQMPEANAEEQKQLNEKVTEVANSTAMNEGNEKTEAISETEKCNESGKSNNKLVGTASPTDVSLQQIDMSSNVKNCNPLVSNQSNIEVISHDITPQATTLSYSTSNSAAEVGTNNECADKKTSATTSVANNPSTESKIGSYKKIDIKAYKERALQRRLKEQAMLKEDEGGKSVSLIQDPQASLPTNKSNIKPSNTTNEANTVGTDANKVQPKDLRLTRLESTGTLLLEESDKEVKAMANLDREDRPVDVTRKAKEPLIPMESRSPGNNETSVIRPVDSVLHIFKDPMKHKEHKRNNKSSLQDIVATRELNESVEKDRSKLLSKERKLKSASEERKSKFTLEERNSKLASEERKSKPAPEEKKLRPASEEKLKKQISTVDSSKFKYIRSEGGKELKLKKEKARRPSEKSKKNSVSKPTDPKSSTAEKHVETHSHKNVSKDNQVLSIVNKNTIEVTQTEIEKANNRDAYEHLPTLRSTCSETCSDPEWAINSKTVQEKINTHPIVKQNEQQSNDVNIEVTNVREKMINKEVMVHVDETISPNQPAADQETATAKSGESLTNSGKEENVVQQVDKDAVKAAAINASSENPSTESLSKQGDTHENVLSMSSILIEHTQSDSTDKHVETVVSSVPRGESHSLSERIDVDIEKSGHTINIRNLKNVGVHNNIPSLSKGTISQVLDENDSTNVERNEGNVVTLTSELCEKVENSEECDSITRNEVSSPDSPRSPFKGFLMDSIDNDICQVSPLYDVIVNNRGDKKDAEKELGRWLNARLGNKPTLLSAEVNKNSSKDSLKRTEGDNESMSTCNLVVENEHIMDQVADDSVSVTDNTKVGTIPTKIEEGEVAETDGIYDISSGQKKSLSVVDADNHDTLDGNNEPLTVLDKHMDDENGKLIGKLSVPDLEDCIARDVDVFTVEPLRKEKSSWARTESLNFNSIDFKELSESFDKNKDDTEQNRDNVTTGDEIEELVLSDEDTTGPPELFAFEERLKTMNTANIVNSVSPFESSSKASKDVTKTIDSFIPEFPVASLQKIVLDDVATVSSKGTREKSTTSELFIAEMKASEDKLRNDLQHDLEPFKMKNETLPKLSVPRESTTKTSQLLQNAPTTASTSETITECPKVNKQHEPDNGLLNKSSSALSEVRIRENKDTTPIRSTVKYDRSKHLSKTSLTKSIQRGKSEALRKIKTKSKLKHKKERRNVSEKAIKEAVKSDITNVNHPSTKEAIMARMIEIDVEIHKLMTEKMTLYQILTSNVNLPSDSNLQNNNTTQDKTAAETLVIRPRTPSVLMSQLIQNIETSPVKNQCAKTAMETLSTKNGPTGAEQPNKSKTAAKHEHCTEKSGSDDGGNVHHSEDSRSSALKKAKKQRYEKAVKKLESKLNSFTSTKDTDSVITEKKQANDAMKLMLKKINGKEATMQQDSSQVSASEARPPEDTNKTFVQQIDKRSPPDNEKVETFKRQEVGITIESAESQTYTEEIVQGNVTELDDESYLMKGNEDRAETLNEKNDANSSEKPSESRASERSSIYSDDSTWDSLFQHSNADEQKRSSTGLALLEETYRKEMARTRKIKAAMRRKKKMKLQNLLETVNTITPDEEELPLSALYVKKLYQKKKLLGSFEQQAELQADDDPQLWKNVVEVINAVAENRTEDLYVRPLGGRSTTDERESVMSDIPKLEDSEFKRNKEEQTIEPLAADDTGEASIKLSRDSENFCENKDDSNNETKKENQQFASCKSQEFLNDKHFRQDFEVAVSTEVLRNSSGTSVCDTSTSIETNIPKPLSVQRTIKNDNVETNRLTSIRDSDSFCTEVNSNDVQSDRCVSDITENSNVKKIEGKIDGEVRETNLEQPVVDVEIEFGRNAITREPTNSASAVTSGDIEKSYDEFLESNGNKSTIVNEAASKEEPDTKVENISEKKLQDSSVSSEKGDNVSNVYADSSYASKNEELANAKECKESEKGKEIEPSNTASNEENNNQNCLSVSSATENAEMLRTDETSGNRLQKRRRENGKTSARRSSRYTEESGKRIKVEADTNASSIELEVQEKNTRTQFPSISSTSSSPCEEIETIWTNTRKNRNQRPPSRKRGTPLPQEVEILCSNGESLRGIKRHKQHTISEIMNCMVKVIDCKHTILNPNAKPNVLQQYGISKVNACMYSNSAQADLSVSSMQSTSTEELSILYSKQTSGLIESPQCQTPKSNQSNGEQINSVKIKRKAAKVDSSAGDKEECTNFDIEVVPVLTKESTIADTADHCGKPDIEIVEERMMVTKNQQQSNSGSTLTVIDTTDDKEYPRTQYTVHKGPILDIKVFENSFLAASEDGRIYRYNQASNGILNIYKGHTAAVTCLYVYKTHSTDINKEWMFSGSLDGTLRCYNIVTGVQVRDTADVSSPIQCMDEAWGKIFIGTKSGHVSRYHVKSGIIKGNTIQFSDKSVLALKATNEGPRRVLIVASRSQPITIRDAQSGLFLRTICGQKSHTVYSLMRDNNLIYCGTSSTSIPVFDFTTGEQTMQYDAGVGIVCMRLYKQLLFAGCYDGNIYVFDTKDRRLICSIPGPGNMLLSMEVIDNKIIAGSKDKRLQSWQMPRQVRTSL